MQTSRTIIPIIHPKRIYGPVRSWKRRSKRVHQYHHVFM